MTNRNWDRTILEAQQQTHDTIAGVEYERIPYGSERQGMAATCHDCAVALGQYHVIGCTVECCPACGGQAWGCSCYGAAGARQ